MTDTRDKRSSAINISMPWRGMLPSPAGSVADEDRQHVMFLYRMASEAAEEVVSSEKHLVIGMGAMGKTRNHPHPLFSRVKQ